MIILWKEVLGIPWLARSSTIPLFPMLSGNLLVTALVFLIRGSIFASVSSLVSLRWSSGNACVVATDFPVIFAFVKTNLHDWSRRYTGVHSFALFRTGGIFRGIPPLAICRLGLILEFSLRKTS